MNELSEKEVLEWFEKINKYFDELMEEAINARNKHNNEEPSSND